MLDLLKNYSTILGLLHLKHVTGSKIGVVLRMINIHLPEELLDLVASMVSEAGQKTNASTLGDVLKDETLMGELSALISAANESSIGQNLAKSIDGSNKDQMAQVPTDSIHVDSVMNCPHCKGVFRLGDSPGIKKSLSAASQSVEG